MTVDRNRDELDAGVTIVTPTRRLAHHLRTRHDAACVARGLVVWTTPDIVTWSELLRRQFELDRVMGRTTARWLEASQARLAWEQVVRRDAAMNTVLAPAGLGATAQRSWIRLHEYEIPPAALASDDSPETRAFARWAESFERWLQAGSWLDPAQAAGSLGPFADDTRLEFVGFDRLTPEQRSFVDRLREDGVEVVVRPGPAEDVAIAAQLVACNDREAELETAARWAAQRLLEQPDARLGLVVPGLTHERARVRAILDRVLVPAAAFTAGPAPESSAYELAAARPVLDRPVVAAAFAWLDAALAPTELTAASALLRGVFDGAAAAESCGRAELDVTLRKLGMPVVGLERLAHEVASRGCPATASRLRAAGARASGWTGLRLPSQWTPEFIALLRDVGWPGESLDSTEHQAVQRLRTLLGEFSASDEVLGPVRPRAALAHLREIASDTAFEPQEIAAPLLVIDPDTATGMRFDALWICGLDSGRWPAPANPDPFLPRDWQARQQVPGATAQLAEQQARRTLQRLSAAATETICSVAQFEAEAPLLPSALVAGLPRLDPLPLWRGVAAAEAQFAERPPLEVMVDGAVPAFAAHEVVKGGARLLELQASCPFRAAVELRLGGTELEHPPDGIAATERGTLAHAVLQAFWLQVRAQSALLAMSLEERTSLVEQLVRAVLEPLRESADALTLRLLDLEARWLRGRVLELLEHDAARAPFTVVATEEPRIADVGGVQTRIVLDRVDLLADGTHAVIDYKTGDRARPAAWMGERPELPQLPLYVRAIGREQVGAVAFGIVCKGRTEYRGFTREAASFPQLKPFDPTKAPFKEYADWDALLQAWHRRLEVIATEHAQGDARLAPNPTRACRYCHLPGLCRSAQAVVAAEEADDDDR